MGYGIVEVQGTSLHDNIKGWGRWAGKNVTPGDVVFLASGEGVPYHATIITGKDADKSDLLYCAHSTNRLDESFNEKVSDEDTFLILKFTDL